MAPLRIPCFLTSSMLSTLKPCMILPGISLERYRSISCRLELDLLGLLPYHLTPPELDKVVWVDLLIDWKPIERRDGLRAQRCLLDKDPRAEAGLRMSSPPYRYLGRSMLISPLRQLFDYLRALDRHEIWLALDYGPKN